MTVVNGPNASSIVVKTDTPVKRIISVGRLIQDRAAGRELGHSRQTVSVIVGVTPHVSRRQLGLSGRVARVVVGVRVPASGSDLVGDARGIPGGIPVSVRVVAVARVRGVAVERRRGVRQLVDRVVGVGGVVGVGAGGVEFARNPAAGVVDEDEEAVGIVRVGYFGLRSGHSELCLSGLIRSRGQP